MIFRLGRMVRKVRRLTVWLTSSLDVSDVAAISGLGLLALGLAMIYLPAAPTVVGVILLLAVAIGKLYRGGS